MISKSKYEKVLLEEVNSYFKRIDKYLGGKVILIDAVVYQKYTDFNNKFYSSSIVFSKEENFKIAYENLFTQKIFDENVTTTFLDKNSQNQFYEKTFDYKSHIGEKLYSKIKKANKFKFINTDNHFHNQSLSDNNYHEVELKNKKHPKAWPIIFFDNCAQKTKYCTIICFNEFVSEINYALFIYHNEKLDYKGAFGNQSRDLGNLQIYNISIGVLVSKHLNDVFQQSLKNTSLKSSLAAVMSRNMSHNIGSHVLNKLSSGEGIHNFFKINGVNRFVQGVSIKDKIKFDFPDLSITSQDVNEDLNEDDERIKTLLEKYEQKLKENPEFLDGYNFYTHEEGKPIYILSPFFVDVNNNTKKEELARVFNDYLKKRMDFVADVATSNKALLSNSKYLFADVFRGFERNLLLLHNISGKDDKFSYEFNFQYCDGKTTYLYGEKGFIDPIVSMPNDILGNQAFYIILENIIRNTAKHSGGGNVVFTIKVEDIIEDDFYRITVFDNVKFSASEKDEEKYGNQIKDFNTLSINQKEDSIKAYKLNKLIAQRNISIAQPVLDENNEIRTAGWGTIEIKLAACYLSGLDMLEMDNTLYAPIGYKEYEKGKESSIEEKATAEELEGFAINEYIDFLLSARENEEALSQFDLPSKSKNKKLKISDCAKTLKRTVTVENIDANASKSLDDNEPKFYTYYPIVQALDGSEDTASGFGYSFLMKKPKKLLVLDKDNQLGFLDNETKKGDLNKLKRLGIDIERKPIQSSIYNHQFMIIVDNDEKEHYNEWFNLPQERCLYNIKDNLLQYFKIEKSIEDIENIKSFKYEYHIEDASNATPQESIKTLLENLEITKIFIELNKLYYNNSNITLHPQVIDKDKETQILDKLELIDDDWLRGIIPDKLRVDLKPAIFDHHGSKDKNWFTGEDNFFSEIYGSVSPIGLYLESIKNQIKKNEDDNDFLESLIVDVQNFFMKGVNIRVMVIDERIQSVLNDKGVAVEANENIPGYDLDYDILFKKSNLLVPPKQLIKDKKEINLDLNSSKLSDYKNDILSYIKEKSEEIDFFIIHFGILESLRNNSDSDTIQKILYEVEESIKNKNCKVVVTSGRGFTPDIRSLNRYFLAYSTLSNMLLDPNNRSKSHLVQCLNQLRINNTNQYV
jgi:hypothetical protein